MPTFETVNEYQYHSQHLSFENKRGNFDHISDLVTDRRYRFAIVRFLEKSSDQVSFIYSTDEESEIISQTTTNLC